MNTIGKFLTGFFLGGITSTLIVMLYTPSSGIEMRARLKDNYYHVRDEVQNAARQRSDELKQELARLQLKS